MEFITLLILFPIYLLISFLTAKYIAKRKISFIGHILNAVIGLGISVIIALHQ